MHDPITREDNFSSVTKIFNLHKRLIEKKRFTKVLKLRIQNLFVTLKNSKQIPKIFTKNFDYQLYQSHIQEIHCQSLIIILKYI